MKSRKTSSTLPFRPTRNSKQKNHTHRSATNKYIYFFAFDATNRIRISYSHMHLFIFSSNVFVSVCVCVHPLWPLHCSHQPLLWSQFIFISNITTVGELTSTVSMTKFSKYFHFKYYSCRNVATVNLRAAIVLKKCDAIKKNVVEHKNDALRCHIEIRNSLRNSPNGRFVVHKIGCIRSCEYV